MLSTIVLIRSIASLATSLLGSDRSTRRGGISGFRQAAYSTESRVRSFSVCRRTGEEPGHAIRQAASTRRREPSQESLAPPPPDSPAHNQHTAQDGDHDRGQAIDRPWARKQVCRQDVPGGDSADPPRHVIGASERTLSQCASRLVIRAIRLGVIENLVRLFCDPPLYLFLRGLRIKDRLNLLQDQCCVRELAQDRQLVYTRHSQPKIPTRHGLLPHDKSSPLAATAARHATTSRAIIPQTAVNRTMIRQEGISSVRRGCRITRDLGLLNQRPCAVPELVSVT